MLKIIGVDWVQLSCTLIDPSIGLNDIDFEIVSATYSTKLFNLLQFVFIEKRLICSIASKPRNKNISENTMILKFENDFLYQINLIGQIEKVLLALNIKFKHFVRLDIYCDFQEFRLNRKPENLIDAIHKDKILKLGKGKGSTNFETSDKLIYTGITFGTHSSSVQAQMYNKTKQMNEVTFKPWISATWDEAEFNPIIDTWRLEFRITGNSKQFKNETNGATFGMKELTLLHHIPLNLAFNALVAQYWAFAKNDNTKNKSRMVKLKLFDNDTPLFVVQDLTHKESSNKSDIIFINMLYKFNQMTKGTADDIAEMSNDIAQYYIYKKDLYHRKDLLNKFSATFKNDTED